MYRWLLALLVATFLLAGSFAVSPAADQALMQFATAQGPALPLDQAKAPKLALVSSLAEALSPKAAAYADGDLTGCNTAPTFYCYVQWCTAYPGGGTTHFVFNRNGVYSDVPIYGPTGVTGCNNWSKIYMQYGMQMIYAYSDRDSVYWMSSGQIGT